MNKTPLVAIGLLAACPLLGPPAQAQSTLGLYGMLDVGVRNAPNLALGEAAIRGVDDASRSRIGLRGKEDLGDGLSAFFRLEHSVRMDNGTQRDARFWDDKAWVGLDHKRYGNVALGRLRSPVDEMTSGSRFEAFEGFSLAAATARYGRADDAWDNGIYYISALMAGFRLGAGVRAGEGAANGSRGGHAEYTAGNLDVGLAFQSDGETPASSKQSYGGGVRYRFTMATLFATYVRTRGLGVTDSGRAHTASVGIRVPMGRGELRAALRRVDTDRLSNANSHAGDIDTTHVGLGYQYPFSKRTSVNASWVRQTRRTHMASGAVATDRRGTGTELALRVAF